MRLHCLLCKLLGSALRLQRNKGLWLCQPSDCQRCVIRRHAHQRSFLQMLAWCPHGIDLYTTETQRVLYLHQTGLQV